MTDNDSILDAYNNALGGAGAGNGNYTGGEMYTIDRTGQIHGRKWDDRDGDGYWDPAEPGLAGITMFLDLNNNSAWDAGEPTAITEADDPGTVRAPGVHLLWRPPSTFGRGTIVPNRCRARSCGARSAR